MIGLGMCSQAGWLWNSDHSESKLRKRKGLLRNLINKDIDELYKRKSEKLASLRVSEVEEDAMRYLGL